MVTTNSTVAWERLLLFPRHCLHKPFRGGQRWSLATQVNRQITDETYVPQATKTPNRANQVSTDYLRSSISLKLSEGDFTGAVRLASSRDSLAPVSDATYSALKAKHPPAHSNCSLPPPPSPPPPDVSQIVTPEMVANAIRSFPAGSSGGPDGLLPQHLKVTVTSLS